MNGDQIGQLVTQAALQCPDRAAITSPQGYRLTYAELDERSTRLANALLASGCTPGDRVGAWLDTCPQYVELYFAVAKAGLVLVPVNSMFTLDEADYQVDHAQVRVLFSGSAVAQLAPVLVERYGLTHVEVGEWSEPADAPYEQLVASGSDVLPPLPDEDDLYLIAYTSGTTGRPKGAMVTHRTLMATLRQHAHSYRTPKHSVLGYHSNMSFVATVLGLVMGHAYLAGTVVLLGRVQPAEFLDLLESEGCTFTFVPSPWIVPMTELARQHPEKWQQVRTFVHSASKANPEDLQRWAAVVGHRFLEGLGMSENSGGLITVTDVDDVVAGSAAQDMYASVGRPVVGTAMRVVDVEGNDLPRDGVSIGELVVQSPSLVVGYWRNPAATAAALRDGWYFTGDLGAIDPAGYVYVSERRNDLIVSGGMNVYPSEIERCVAALPGVVEVAVVGVPHPRWGQTPVAVVVADPARGLTQDDVVEHCRGLLASYKKPSRVVFVDELPRSASNKVLKRVLREQLAPVPA